MQALLDEALLSLDGLKRSNQITVPACQAVEEVDVHKSAVLAFCRCAAFQAPWGESSDRAEP